MKPKSTRTIAALAAVLAALVAIVLWRSTALSIPAPELASTQRGATPNGPAELSRAASSGEKEVAPADAVSEPREVEPAAETRASSPKRTWVLLLVDVTDPTGSLKAGERYAAHLYPEGADHTVTLPRGSEYRFSVPAGRALFLLDQQRFKPVERWIEIRADESEHRESIVLEPAWTLGVHLSTIDGRSFCKRLRDLLRPPPRMESQLSLSVTASVDPPGQTTDVKHLLRNEWIDSASSDDLEIDIVDDPPVHVSVFLGHRLLATQRLDARVQDVTFTIGQDVVDSQLSRLVLRVADAYTAGPLDGIRASLVDPLGSRAIAISDVEGRVPFPPQASGLYTLELDWENRFMTSRTVQLIAGETLDLGTIELTTGVEISGRISDGDAEPKRIWDAVIVADDAETGTTSNPRLIEVAWDGRFSTWGFAAGRYVLNVISYERKAGNEAGTWLGSSGPISIDTRAGPVKDLTVEMQRLVGVRWKPTVADFQDYQCTVRCKDGRFLNQRRLGTWAGCIYAVAPGSYVLTVTRLGEVITQRTFEAWSDGIILEVP